MAMMELVLIHSKNPLAKHIGGGGVSANEVKKNALSVCVNFSPLEMWVSTLPWPGTGWGEGYGPSNNNNDSNNSMVTSILC